MVSGTTAQRKPQASKQCSASNHCLAAWGEEPQLKVVTQVCHIRLRNNNDDDDDDDDDDNDDNNNNNNNNNNNSFGCSSEGSDLY